MTELSRLKMEHSHRLEFSASRTAAACVSTSAVLVHPSGETIVMHNKTSPANTTMVRIVRGGESSARTDLHH
jgi:hypothetical protein